MACSQSAHLKTLVNACATDHVHSYIDFLITAVDGALHPRVFPRGSSSRGVISVFSAACASTSDGELRWTLTCARRCSQCSQCASCAGWTHVGADECASVHVQMKRLGFDLEAEHTKCSYKVANFYSKHAKKFSCKYLAVTCVWMCAIPHTSTP